MPVHVFGSLFKLFLLLSFKCSFNILVSSSLSEVSFANIFSQTVACFLKEKHVFRICLDINGQELLLTSCLRFFFHTLSGRYLVISMGFLDTDEEFWERRVGLL